MNKTQELALLEVNKRAKKEREKKIDYVPESKKQFIRETQKIAHLHKPLTVFC